VGDRHLVDRVDGAPERWKLNLDDEGNPAHGIPKNPFASPRPPLFERHNLSADPEERDNRVDDAKDALSRLTSLLDSQPDAERLLPYTEIRRLGSSTTNRRRFRGPSSGRS
jgi:hypothetical protein